MRNGKKKEKIQNSSKNSRKRGILEKESIQKVGKAIRIFPKDIPDMLRTIIIKQGK